MIFRYPGGKGKLVKKFLHHIPLTKVFSDCFVGGGSVALAVAMRNKKTQIYLNDLDPWISSFWSIVVGENETDFSALKEIIKNTEITMSVFIERKKTFAPEDFSKRYTATSVEAAFNALFFNRTTFSGSLGSGPIGGYDQSGDWHIYVRWNAPRLVKEITDIRKLLLGRTFVTCLDFQEAIDKLPLECFIYADPPYSVKGKTLYGSDFKEDDHRRLFNILSRRQDWLLSCDSSVFIKTLYTDFVQKPLKSFCSMTSDSIRSTGATGARELLIFSKGANMEQAEVVNSEIAKPEVESGEEQILVQKTVTIKTKWKSGTKTITRTETEPCDS
jgi:DNA adenine methylase